METDEDEKLPLTREMIPLLEQAGPFLRLKTASLTNPSPIYTLTEVVEFYESLLKDSK